MLIWSIRCSYSFTIARVKVGTFTCIRSIYTLDSSVSASSLVLLSSSTNSDFAILLTTLSHCLSIWVFSFLSLLSKADSRSHLVRYISLSFYYSCSLERKKPPQDDNYARFAFRLFSIYYFYAICVILCVRYPSAKALIANILSTEYYSSIS